MKKSLKPGGEFIVLDHIGAQRRNRIFSFAISGILLLYPFYTQLTYKEKIKRILKILLKQSTEEGCAKDNNFDVSPFEDVSQDEIVKNIKRNFHVISYWTLLSFCSHNLTSINIKNRKLFYKTISFLKRMDDMLIQLHVLRGEYVFIHAEKR